MTRRLSHGPARAPWRLMASSGPNVSRAVRADLAGDRRATVGHGAPRGVRLEPETRDPPAVSCATRPTDAHWDLARVVELKRLRRRSAQWGADGVRRLRGLPDQSRQTGAATMEDPDLIDIAAEQVGCALIAEAVRRVQAGRDVEVGCARVARTCRRTGGSAGGVGAHQSRRRRA